jgi:hypothetical protein
VSEAVSRRMSKLVNVRPVGGSLCPVRYCILADGRVQSDVAPETRSGSTYDSSDLFGHVMFGFLSLEAVSCERIQILLRLRDQRRY